MFISPETKSNIVVDPVKADLTEDQRAVVDVIKRCLMATHVRDTATLRQVFHPTASHIGWDEGDLRHVTLEPWLAFVDSIPSPESTGQVYDKAIEWLEVCGTAAIVRVRAAYRAFSYVAYFSLVKTTDGWRIVFECYNQERTR